MGVLIQPQSATASSDGDSLESVAVFVEDSQIGVAPQFSIYLGLETPELAKGLRVFASGGIVPTVAFNIDVAKLGDPRGFAFPAQRDDFEPYPEEAVDGVGIRTTAQVEPVSWAANLGVSFTKEIRDRQIVFKPSVGWYRFSVAAEGVRLRIIKPDDVDPFYREISLYDSSSQTFDAVGPAFEIGVDLGRKGMFKPTMFIETNFYRVLGDRTIGLSNSGSDSFGTEWADWALQVNKWSFRVGLGMRIAWIGR